MYIFLLLILLCTPVMAEDKLSLEADKAQAVADIAAIELQKAPLVDDLMTDLDAVALAKLKAKSDAIKVKEDAIKAKQALIKEADEKIYLIEHPVVVVEEEGIVEEAVITP